jgi:hypothetical protein
MLKSSRRAWDARRAADTCGQRPFAGAIRPLQTVRKWPTLVAIRRASSRVSNLAADRRHGSSSKWALNARWVAARIMERCEVARIGDCLGVDSIGHHHLEAARSMDQAVARSMGQEGAARNTRIGQRQATRSGARQRYRIRRRAQPKVAEPQAVGAQALTPHSAHKTRRVSQPSRQITK